MLKRKLILGIMAISLALVTTMIVPLASADNNNDQNKHGDDDKSKCRDDDKSKCRDDADTNSNSQYVDATWKSNIEKTLAFLTDKINKLTSSSTSQSLTDTSPVAIYTHLDVGTCTIDPITLVPFGWCPDGQTVQFFIPDSSVTKYSVVSITTVPPVINPLSPLQCSEQSINFNVGTTQGFGIICNYAALPGSGLNYIIFNPGHAWYTNHKITP